MGIIIDGVVFALEIYKWILLARVLLSWLPMAGIHLDPYNVIIRFLYRVTEPVLLPLRPYSRMGMMDLSPLIAFFVIGFIQSILRGRSISQIIAFTLSLVVALSVHEFAHAWVAYQLGDSTAKNRGRLSLDPRRHLDVLGSIMVLAVGFGWAKPVPVNPYNLRSGPKTGMATVAVAGPFSNLLLAIIVAFPLRLGVVEAYYASRYLPNPQEILFTFVLLNVVLVFFNLLPIAPLDGFKVLLGLLPQPAAQSFQKLEPLGPLILLLLIFFGGAFLSTLIFTPTNFVMRLLLT
jgi:Zn-dependent protease